MQSGVHCKVECNKEIRRFLFNGTEFASLYEQIKNLFSLQREFVLKYKDEEGDMVTISTSEELSFAMSCLVPSQALRLEVTLKEQATGPVEVKMDKKACKKWGGGAGQCNNVDWKRQKMQGYLERLQAMPENDCNREWRQKKIEHLQTKIACLDSAQQGAPASGAGECNNWQSRANNHMQQKKEQIAAKIEKLSSIPPTEGNYECRQKKIEKLKQKLAWLEKRQACMQSGAGGGCKQMSAEEKAKFEASKAQMKQIRQNMCNLRSQIHQKKGEWHMAPKENKEAISKEICALKDQMKAQKEQMCALRSHC